MLSTQERLGLCKEPETPTRFDSKGYVVRATPEELAEWKSMLEADVAKFAAAGDALAADVARRRLKAYLPEEIAHGQ